MKRYIRYTLCLLCILLTSCVKDTTEDSLALREGDPVEMILRIGDICPFVESTVTTRQTMPNVADESRIYNLYIYIFNSTGQKIYGCYFDNTNDVDNEAALTSATDNAWWVRQPTDNTDATADGLVKIFTSKATGATIFAIANIDSKMVNISPEKLGLVQTQNDMVDMVATLNQDFVERTGYFPMTGYLTGVDTDAINHTSSTPDASSLELKRIDAKVKFNFNTGPKITTFEIKSWQVCNVSRDSYILDREARAIMGGPTGDSAHSYFDIEERPAEFVDYTPASGSNPAFETTGFSFYLLDNAHAPKATPAGGWNSYAQREMQEKEAGTGLNGDYLYAPDKGTFVRVKATLIMNTEYDFNSSGSIDVGIEDAATLNADVEYIIHLGNFSSGGTSFGNFETLRNTYYTYNVTINGAEDIKVEVITSNDGTPNDYTENSPGATGEVTIAMQTIQECDAHYESFVMTFYANYIKADDVTWYVRTPFCLDNNTPTVEEGTDVTTGLDFRWVEFRLNDVVGSGYSDTKEPYFPHRTARDIQGNLLMNESTNPNACLDTWYVDELVKYLREQKRLKDRGEPNDFRGTQYGGEIKVTAYVNEFYYEYHPTTGDPITTDNTLWRRAINQDEPRVMHILSDVKVSTDQESTLIGSAFTIRQKSIQSVYNHQNDDLPNAWGTEHVDEYERSEIQYVYYVSASESNSTKRTGVGNTSPTNGRQNTLKEWDVYDDFASGETSTLNWSDYIDFTQGYQDMLQSGCKNLRFSCMARNRDNNANGKIDLDEVRWYMASISQLTTTFMGQQGIQPSGYLYNRTAQQRASTNPDEWRQHVISSTSSEGNSNNPQLIWAEEGVSTGTYYNSYQYAGGSVDKGYGTTGALKYYTIRCVRNLNMDSYDNTTGYGRDAEPVDVVQIETATVEGNTVIRFNLDRMNSRSYRYLLDDNSNLVFNDENSMENRLYPRFEVASNAKTYDDTSFYYLNEEITSSMIGNTTYCPEGYRLPNQRELAMMHIYDKTVYDGGTTDFFSDLDEVPCRTYYSFGALGSNKENNKYGFQRETNIYLPSGINDSKTNTARCVRDVPPEEWSKGTIVYPF